MPFLRRRWWSLLPVVFVVAVSGVAAYTGGHRVDLARGHALFLARSGDRLSCAFCHTLRAAAATGPFGPDLDNIWNEEPKGFTRAAFQKASRRRSRTRYATTRTTRAAACRPIS